MPDLDRRLAGLSPEKRRLLELRMRGATTPAGRPLVPAARDGGPLPLSFAQQRLWLVERMAPGGSAYTVPHPLRIRGPLDAAALERALDGLRARHESLRTVFAETPEGPVQVVRPASPVPLPVEDLSHLPPQAREAELRRRVDDDADTPFDLETGPPVRAHLLRLGAEDHALLLTLHHAFTDGWSMGVLARELGALYAAARAGLPDPLPPVPLQYADFALWQREWLSGETLERHLAFWRDALEGAPAALELPADRPRPPVPSGRGGTVKRVLPPALVERLRALARAEEATLFTVLLAGYRLLLARHAGEDDVVVGTPVAGRTRREVEGTVGFFVNTLPLRVPVAGDPSFRARVRAERSAVLAAFQHQELPFERMVEALRLPREASRNPLFQAMLTLQTARMDPVELEGCRVERIEVGYRTAKFDLTFDVYEEADGGLRLEAEYAADLFDPSSAERLADHFHHLLASAAADPDRPLSRLARMAAEERARVAERWSRGPAQEEGSLPVHRLFAETAARVPDAVAVDSGDGPVTYAALEAASDRLARRLRAAGAGPEGRVGVAMERSVHLPTALLAVLKAGAAYVPLDPSYPAQRLAWMAEDAGCALLLADGGVPAGLAGFPGPVVDLLADDGADTGGEGPPDAFADADSLAYVVYTSGSTGTPKGVGVTHRAIVRLVRGTDYVSLGAGDRVAQVSSPSFDALTFEVWGALLNGATLVGIERDALLAPAALAEAFRARGITAAFLTAALFRGVAAEAPDAFRGVRHLLAGGEALDPAAVRAVLGCAPPERLVNGYGPTECTTFAVCGAIGALPADAPSVPLGRPIAGTLAYVEAGGELAAPGEPGELLLGGAGLARGYPGRPALTAERFVPDPFSGEAGARLYRTGDRARWREDGTLDFLGRLDRQVKVRGFRVEPGEVEAALGALPEVAACVVEPRPDPAGGTRLVAYAVPRDGATAAALRDALRARLPEHLVPGAWVLLESIPVTPNGKVDRRALPEPGAAHEAADAPLRTPTEEALAEVWRDVLGVAAPGAEDDFFLLGGHSLLATRVVARIRAVFGRELPLRAVFEAPTLRALAARVDAALRGGAPAPPPLEPAPRAEAMPLSFAQERMWFLERIAAGSGAYNMPVAWEIAGPLDAEALRGALEAVVHRHEALRTALLEGASSPVQRVLPPAPFPLPLVEVADAGEVPALVAAEGARPFDLEAGAPIRAVLYRSGPERHWLALTLHHAVADGWSFGILFREVEAAYAALAAGAAPELPPVPLQYPDFAAWQRGWLAGEALEAQLSYWRGVLEDAPVLELPTDRRRPAAESFRGAVHPFAVGAEPAAALRRLAAAEGATPFMLGLAVFAALLGRYAGVEDVVVGTPVAGRNHAGTEEVVGLFVNTLALRTDLAGAPSLRALLGRVRERVLDAYAHQDLPFERLVEALQVERSLARHPIFQVSFALDQGLEAELCLPGVDARELPPAHPTSKFDLTLSLHPDGDGFAGTVEYATDLFDAATVERFAAHYLRLLEGALAEPDAPVERVTLLAPEARAGALAWGRNETPYPRDATVHGLFAEVAAARPDAVALEWEGRATSYAELDARANRLAHHLRSLGVGPEAPVAVAMERSPASFVALLAILKAGGAYLPLDTAHPAERLRGMLEEAGVRALVVPAAVPPSLAWWTGPRTSMAGDAAAIAARPATAPEGRADPDQLAYVVHTSGSTGRPKGIAVSHRAVVRLVRGADHHPFAADERIAQVVGHTFDVLTWEVWGALCNGAALVGVSREEVLDPARLVRVLRERRVTTAFLPSAVFARVAREAPDGLRGMRMVMAGGEAVDPAAARAVLAAGPPARLLNGYGPAENTAFSTWHPIDSVGEDASSIPIGRPLSNSTAYVLDAGLRLLPAGPWGELFVGGDGVARGYAGRPGLTAERFLPDPFGPPGSRLYRTGDRARWRADGVVEFGGRTDFQLKVRGIRIEPGEVEAALTALPEVGEAVVVGRDDGAGELRLVAYLTPAPGASPRAAELRAALSRTLPEAMVPAAYVVLDALPLTPNNKVDRAALPAPEPRAADPAAAPPETETERLLARIWGEMLRVPRVGRDDHFFALGGHSLMAMRLVSALREEAGVELPLGAVFEAPRLRDLAARVDVLADRGLDALAASLEGLSEAELEALLGLP